MESMSFLIGKILTGTTTSESSVLPVMDDDTLETRRSNHGVRLLEKCHQFRRSGLFCDVALETDSGQRYEAHRTVLCASSAYFEGMFAGGLSESQRDVVRIRGIEDDAMYEIVEYAYTARASITPENIQSLLSAASMLQITALTEMCTRALATYLNAENCIGIRRFADAYHLDELRAAATTYALVNFGDVVRHDEFDEQTDDELIELIGSDRLNVRREESVFNAVVKWVAFDEASRGDRLVKILEYIRLPLVSWSFLKQTVAQHELLKSREDCLSFVKEAYQYQSKEFHPDLLPHQCNPSVLRSRPRQSFMEKEYIYIVGGERSPGRQFLDSIEVYKPGTGEWSKMPSLPAPCRGPGITTIGDDLYIVGGWSSHALNTLHVLNLKTKVWKQKSPMSECRSSVAVVAAEDGVYAFGGYNDYSSVRSVERYDPDENTWKKVSDMLISRSMADATCLDNYIYVIGGYDGITDLKSAEKYDLKDEKWSLISDMHVRRCMLSVTVCKNYIYAVGGMDNDISVTSAERYCPTTDQWTLIACMELQRSGLGLVTVRGCLYALAGYNDISHMNSVEKYDPEKDEWSICGYMEINRWRFGCCT
ncbi:kelch-like protein 24a [Tubulanus polymorphus]|uniref:kelch-like protein 24a n=1 Tax=Tubulanus polymorphus TaxID=672921 RepID=UPI003DA6BB36